MRILKPLPGILPMPGHPLANTAGLWPMNSLGNKAFDLSGNNYGLNFVNFPVWSSSKFGSAILFDDALSQYLQVELPVVVEYPFSFACWFKTDNYAVEQMLIWVGDKDVSDYWTGLYLSIIGNKISAFSHAYGGVFHYALTTASYVTNTWQHAAGVWVSRSERYAYLNGRNKGSDMGTVGAMANHDRTAIGSARDSTPGDHMSGLIAMGVVWNYALTDAEIMQHYRESFCMFPENIMPEFAISA